MSRARDLVLEGALAVTLGAERIIADSEIVIRGDRIQAVRRRGRRRRAGSEIIDCTGRIAMPGLVNAHVHSEYLLLKGLVENLRLAEWDESELYVGAWNWVRDPANVDRVKCAYVASYLESVRGGTTLIGEFNCADAAIHASIDAMGECGIRGVPTVDLARRDAHLDVEELGCMHAMDDEEELTEEELRRARKLLESRDGVRLTMHAAETAERMVLIQARLGRTTVELLDAHGLLGPHLLLSHAIHVTPAEIERLAETRTRVVSSPVAEMKLADGIGPICRMLQRGIPVGLGTDAAVCNNGSDLFQEMKAAALLQKLTIGAHAMTSEQALQMATLNGARCLGLSDDLGAIEEGKLADIALLDARSPRLTPLIHNDRHSNVFPNLVYCATASDVVDVIVGGRFVVRARRHTSLDEAEVLGALQAAAEQMHREVAE